MTQERERVQWEQAEAFSEGGLSVQVMRLPLPRPKFTVVVGSSYKDREGTAKQGARIAVQINKGQVQPVDLLLLEKLLSQAREWIQGEVDRLGPPPPQRQQSKRPDDGQRRGPKGPMLGLKELKKRDKAAWQARQAEKEAAAQAQAQEAQEEPPPETLPTGETAPETP